MFTGIIETLGRVAGVSSSGTNKTFWIASSLVKELKVDQSLSHNGVCLTVEEVKGLEHRVTAISETLDKSTLGNWAPGTLVNLERCLALGGRLDGHLVQGHVDATGVCLDRREKDGSWEFRIGFGEQFAPLVIEKGSISLNGISLTIFDVSMDGFTVAIIPYTFAHTNMQSLRPGDGVNLEFDLIGKYVQRQTSLVVSA